MRMDQLIESIEEALSDQDKNKLDYLRKREKEGKLKPMQKGDLRKLDRIAKSDQHKSAAASWGVQSGPKHKQLAAHHAATDASKPSQPSKPKSFLGKLGQKLHRFAIDLAGAR
jgi:hypothetical protein